MMIAMSPAATADRASTPAVSTSSITTAASTSARSATVDAGIDAGCNTGISSLHGGPEFHFHKSANRDDTASAAV
jgi:hypothetical protein